MAQSLRLRFKKDLANLHDIGYLTVDVYQLVAFGETLAQGNAAEAEQWFGEKARPFNRYASVLERYARTSTVTDARKGSIELWITVGSLAASIIVPLVAIYIQRELGNPEIDFEIGVEDQTVQRALEAYATGAFGRGPEAFVRLSEHLERRERSVRLVGNNAILIDAVLARYSKRMVRTIRRP